MKFLATALMSLLLIAGCGGSNNPQPNNPPECEAPKVIVDGSCVNPTPVDPVCEPPTVLENGVCVGPSPVPVDPVCEPPTVLQSGQCVTPVDPEEPQIPFAATLTTGPTSGNISGNVTLVVTGTGMQNVELLPAVGYTPMHGRFTLSGNTATLTIDTKNLPNGTNNLRIAAFNTPPQGGGVELVVERLNWNIQNRVPQDPNPIPGPTPILPVGQTDAARFIMTFQDEFNGTSLDRTKWNTKLWYLPENPRNNFAVEDGVLKLWVEPPFAKDNREVDTDGKFEQRYGYFESRMKLTCGRNLWPAFWLYAHPGSDRPEIDIMEAYGGGGPASGWGDANLCPNNFGLTLHRAPTGYDRNHQIDDFKMRDHAPFRSNPVNLAAGFHVYAVDWRADGIQFYFDGQPIGPRLSNSDGYFSKPMYVIFDLWLENYWGGYNPPTGKSNSFEVDYVRVWQHR